MTPIPPRPRRARRALAHVLAAALAALAASTPPAPAQAQGGSQPTKAARDEASSRFKKGIELFNDGDYHAALIEFRRAYELVPTWGVLYNIGQVQFQLQDYAAALSSLERYLSEGGRQVPAARRAEVEKDIQKLKGRISHIDLTINVPDAEVSVDDVSIGKGPFTKPITVSAGRRKITVSREGYATQSKTVDLASNDTTKLTFDLVERPGQPASADPKPAPAAEGGEEPDAPPEAPSAAPDGPTPATGTSIMPVAGWVATGAFAAGAVVCGVLALGASSDLKDLRAQQGASPEALSDAASKTTTLAIVTDVLTGAALIAGGISIYYTVTSPSPAPTAGARAVRVGVSPSGVRVLGTF